MSQTKKDYTRGKIAKPLAAEIVKYINDPIARSDFEHSYDTMLDINRAHVVMLAKQGIIAKDVAAKILRATDEIQGNRILPDFSENIEDLYTNLEGRLIKMVGMEIGGQQHTARSRNDLGATVVRMDTRTYYLELAKLFIRMRRTILELAKKNLGSVLSGYTHMQPSEPITFAHYLSGVLSGLSRDYQRYANVWNGLNLCPLGSGSMGSTSYHIDRELTASLLGFNGPIQNSIDSVASRDFALETVVTLAMASDTMSRLAFDLYIWSTPEYGYIEVDDSCAVCSSIMPQKKNPFTLEHMKGLAGHMEGFVVGIYSCMKNIIYSHSKDTSVEATRYLFEAMHDMEIDFTLANITLGTLTVKRDRMRQNALKNFCTVTELANYLVKYDGIPFRQAHHVVAAVVAKCCDEGWDSSRIDRNLVNEIARDSFGFETKLTDRLVREALDPARITEAKTCIGGTSELEVSRQLGLLEAQIQKDEAELVDRMRQVDSARAWLAEEADALANE
jgi:argininosuccinate lyase